MVPAQTLMSNSDRPVISLIVPVYNEELVIDEFRSRIVPVLEKTNDSFEIICVNDGSRDKSAEMLDAICAADSRFKAVHFSRNFGHQAAVTAGMSVAKGQCAIIIDADLQDPPELIQSLLDKWRQGFEVVYAQRRARAGESRMKRGTAFMFYRILGRVTEIDVPVDTGDFCLIDRKVIDVMNSMPEHNRYLRGLRAWVGFRQTSVQFDRAERHAGVTKYPLRRMMRLALDGFFSLSKLPLRMALWLGFISVALSFLVAIGLLIQRMAAGYSPGRGWAWMIAIVLFIGGIQLISIGALGEYIGRIYDEVKQRPLYVIARTSGL
jgi:dolichol-phosphate mannosyltransferase